MPFFECDFKKTESKEKLVSFLKRFFPDAEFKEEKGKITGNTNLKKFKEISEEQGAFMIMKMFEEEGQINIDKLAMQAGKIALDERGPLGCVAIKE